MDNVQIIFLWGTLCVLAIPGPTNTLLFVSGITMGFCASLNLVLAEVGAYILSISFLRYLVIPALSETTNKALYLCCSIYLAYLALQLWRSGDKKFHNANQINFYRVFVTTLLNPKNLIFAFGIFPGRAEMSSDILSYWIIFSATCVSAAFCWIAGGAVLQSSLFYKPYLNRFYRGEALLLVGFAIFMLFIIVW